MGGSWIGFAGDLASDARMAIKSDSSQRRGAPLSHGLKRGPDVNLISEVKPGRQNLPAWIEARANSIVSKSRCASSLSSVLKSQAGLFTGMVAKATLLTVSEVAAHFQVSEKTIRRLIKAGDMPVVRLGRSVRLHPEVIEKIVRQDE